MTPEKETKMINSPKILLAIFWNSDGFRVIDVLPTGYKFNSDYHISHILDPVSKIPPQYRADPHRHFVIHAEKPDLIVGEVSKVS
jgi:hypothetical protein